MSGEVNKTEELITSIIIGAIIVVFLVLGAYISINAVQNAELELNGNSTQTNSIINETGFSNSSGYLLSHYGDARTSSFTLTNLYNRTDGTVVSLGNVTLSSGRVINTTIKAYGNLSISYTYVLDTTNSTELSKTYTGIKENTLNMVANFFDLMPTVGIILAVALLIGVIVILVIYVKRMKDSGNTEEVYAG